MALDFSDMLAFPEVTEPLIITNTGTTNDVKSSFVSTGLTGKPAPASVLLFTGAAPVVTGIQDGVYLQGTTVGRRLLLVAQGGDLVINDEDAGSRAENRITCGGAPVTIPQGTAAWLTYDAVNKRWRLASGGGGGGGGFTADDPQKSVQVHSPTSHGHLKSLEFYRREDVGRLHVDRISMTGWPELVFSGSTITRVSGSWIADGFPSGAGSTPLTIRNIESPYQTANNGAHTITNVTTTVLTLSSPVTSDDIAASDVLAMAVTLEAGGYQTLGLVGQALPNQGARRVSQIATNEPDRVIDACRDSGGNTIPLLAFSRNDEVMSGATYDQSNSNDGILHRVARLEAWSTRNSDVQKERWVDQSITYSERTRGKTSTSTNTPSNIVWDEPWTGSVRTVVTLRAVSSTAVKYWTWENGILLDIRDPQGKSWTATFNGQSSTSPVACTGDNVSGTIGWFATVDIYGNAGGGATGARKYFLDPRDFGAVWDGVTDDLPALQRMHDSIPTSRVGITTVQLPQGTGYCSDNWHISRRLDIHGYGHEGIDSNTNQVYNGIKFAPLKGVIFEGAFVTGDISLVPRADGCRVSNASIMSTQCVVTDEGGNTGSGSRMLSSSVDVWANLPATVSKGTVVLRSGAATGELDSFLNKTAATNTTHKVMFRCTTSGTKGSSEPGAFATATISNLGNTITATSGTAVWTVESVPKDYVNSHAYVVGERVFVQGDTDHVYECTSAGTSITGSAQFTIYGLPKRIPPSFFTSAYNGKFYDTSTTITDTSGTLPTATINAVDTADFPSSGNIQVQKTDGTYATVAYTGKTGTSFTGCTGGTGSFVFGAFIGKTGLKWKHVVGAELITVLANTIHFENIGIFGSTGCALYITSIADLETYPSGNGFPGGSNYWGLKNSSIAFCGSGVTINGTNCNQGRTCHIQQKFMGTGRTNVDDAAYFNIAAPGKWGNGACGIKDRNIGTNYHEDSYPEFVGGIPYRNDTFGGLSIAGGNFATFVKVGNEAGWNGLLAPLFNNPCTVVGNTTPAIFTGSAGTILDPVAGQNLHTNIPMVAAPTVLVESTVGHRLGGAIAAFSCQVPSTEGVPTGLTPGEELTFGPNKWWAFGVANQPGGFDQIAFYVPRPTSGATWPGGTALSGQPLGDGKYPLWIASNRVWLGALPFSDPSSIGFTTGVPAAGRFVAGAVSFEQAPVVGNPMGWVCTVTGSVGTQIALPALEDAALARTRQAKTQWRDDAITSPTAAKTGVDSGRVTTSTSATTANQVLATIALNDNTTTVLDVVVTAKLPSSTSGASCKLSGSFTRSGSTVTRLGADDIGGVKGTGAAGTPTFDLNISSTSIQVRTTPSSASATDWAVVYQIVEGKN